MARFYYPSEPCLSASPEDFLPEPGVFTPELLGEEDIFLPLLGGLGGLRPDSFHPVAGLLLELVFFPAPLESEIPPESPLVLFYFGVAHGSSFPALGGRTRLSPGSGS